MVEIINKAREISAEKWGYEREDGLTEIIHYCRKKRARSSEISLAIVKFVMEG